MGAKWVQIVALLVCFLARPPGAGGAGFESLPLLSRCVPSLCPLCCFACGVLLADMALFGFLLGFSAGFGVVVWVCVVLVLCVDCGAFVCVSG